MIVEYFEDENLQKSPDIFPQSCGYGWLIISLRPHLQICDYNITKKNVDRLSRGGD